MTRTRRPSERGMVLAATGIGLAAFFALAVVAIDLGRLGFTATEVQAVADIAATAGATAVINGGNPVGEAQSVVALNSVDGAAASIAAGDVIVGRYDLQSASFTPGGTPANAVRANATATVNNILASILGSPTTTVDKTATAVFTTVASAVPELPIAIGSCYFQNLCDGCLPPLVQVPTSDNGTGGENNTAWTGFFGTASQQNMASYFPAPCGGDVTPPEIEVGDSISLNNGQLVPLLNAVDCLVSNGINEFVVPVVQSPGSDCSTPMNQTAPVTGFVTLVVDSVKSQGSPKYISLHAIFNGSVPGRPGGCTNCGSGLAVLVD